MNYPKTSENVRHPFKFRFYLPNKANIDRIAFPVATDDNGSRLRSFWNEIVSNGQRLVVSISGDDD